MLLKLKLAYDWVTKHRGLFHLLVVIPLLLVIIQGVRAASASREANARAERDQARAEREQVERDFSRFREDQKDAFIAADRKYREAEHAYQEKIENARAEYVRKSAEVDELDRRAADALASGSRRVRVHTLSSNPSCPQPPAPATSPARADAEAGAELAPEVGAELYRIAAYGDETARQLAELQAWVEQALKFQR